METQNEQKQTVREEGKITEVKESGCCSTSCCGGSANKKNNSKEEDNNGNS
jgi:hypothetical protein